MTAANRRGDMKIELNCQGCGAKIPTGAWYNTREGIAILVPSVCSCMSLKDKEPTEIMHNDDCWKLSELITEYGAEAVIAAAEGMVKK